MQLEITNLDTLITQANPKGTPRKAVRPQVKNTKVSPRKHIAEQFEFPFVHQLGRDKSSRNVPVALQRQPKNWMDGVLYGSHQSQLASGYAN
jgi:hypothetical protein